MLGTVPGMNRRPGHPAHTRAGAASPGRAGPIAGPIRT